MQLFRCPFCGTRDETEFRYFGEAGKTRPEGGRMVEEADWTRYLYFQANHKGVVREIWCHQTCGDICVLERNNVTHAVTQSTALQGVGGEAVRPDATAAAASHDLGAS